MSTSYFRYEPEELMKNENCPACGWHDHINYEASHVVTFVCPLCGFSTLFIDPNGGIEPWELDDDYDEEDPDATVDAIMAAEKKALEDASVEHKMPTQEAVIGAKIMIRVSRINDWFFDFINEIKEDIREPWKVGRSRALEFIFYELFKTTT